MKNVLFAGILMVVCLLQGGRLQAQTVPFVNAAVADTEFYKITADDMDRLRELKIFMGSRSLGGNIRDGFERLKDENPMYDFTSSRFESGTSSNFNGFPMEPFDTYGWVHNFTSPSPYNARIYEMQTLLESAPWHYQDDIDVFWIQYHACDSSVFAEYSTQMDAMRARNPHITFIYTTVGMQGPAHTTDENRNNMAFSRMVREKYQGNQAIYDLGDILSDDGRCEPYMCPEYTSEDLHPNSEFIEKRMGKAALVLLYKLFIENAPVCTTTVVPSTPENVSGHYIDRYTNRITFDASELPTCGIKEYLIRRDGADIGASKGGGYVDRDLDEGTAYVYTVAAVGNNDSVSAWSEPCTLSTYDDTVRPAIRIVQEIARADTIVLEFTEQLDPVSAATAGNYAINKGVSVLNAAAAGSIVTLTTTPLAPDTAYTLTVTGVADNSVNANTVAPGTEEVLTYIVMTVDDVYLYMKLDGDLKDEGPSNIPSVWQGTASYTTGVSGQSVALNGGTAYVNVSLGSRLTGVPKLTMCAWAKKDAADVGGGRIIYRHAVYGIATSGTDGITASLTNSIGVTRSVTGTADIADTDWHHYALSFDGTTMTVYIDGRAVGSIAHDGPVVTTSRTVNIGAYPYTSPVTAFRGAIDEVRMYDWALTASQMAELYAEGAVPVTDSAAVAAILAANGDGRAVASVSQSDSTGRIIKLYLQNDLGGTVFNVPSDIGQLTEMTLLHLYGVEEHDHVSTMLTSIDPAIGNCTSLTELILNDNDLTTLPVEITGLTGLISLDVGNNLLCDVSDTLRGWLDTYDPDWESTQACAGVAVATPVISPAAGVFTDSVTVSISCATTDAVVRYTIDGTDVTGASPAYAGSFTVAVPVTVTARGFKAGRDSSSAVVAAYTLDGNDTVYVNGIGVIASADDGNGPENTLDGSLATRWSADGQGEWIQYDFGRTVNFTGIGVSFYRGDERTSTIAVSVSDDGSSWTGVLGSTTSSGTTTELEDFPFDTTFTGRYLRITGYGNSTNDWVSFTEVRFDTVAGTVGMANPGNGITGHGIRIFSNPVQGTAVITTAGPVQVFDAAGGLVHSFPGNRRSSKTVLWGGTDMAGQPVENGIYVIRAGNAVKRIMYRK